MSTLTIPLILAAMPEWIWFVAFVAVLGVVAYLATRRKATGAVDAAGVVQSPPPATPQEVRAQDSLAATGIALNAGLGTGNLETPISAAAMGVGALAMHEPEVIPAEPTEEEEQSPPLSAVPVVPPGG